MSKEKPVSLAMKFGIGTTVLVTLLFLFAVAAADISLGAQISIAAFIIAIGGGIITACIFFIEEDS
jgi:hypothetical protein